MKKKVMSLVQIILCYVFLQFNFSFSRIEWGSDNITLRKIP